MVTKPTLFAIDPIKAAFQCILGVRQDSRIFQSLQHCLVVDLWIHQSGCSNHDVWCLQRSTIDFVAISLGVVMSLRPAASQLTVQRPPQLLCTIRNFVMLLISISITSMAYWGVMHYLQTQSFWRDTPPNTSVSARPPSLLLPL